MGLRFGEIMGLQLGDINFEEQSLTVKRTVVDRSGRTSIGQPKTIKSNRKLVIPNKLMQELQGHIEKQEISTRTEHLFTDSKGGLARRGNYRKRVLQPAIKQTGLQGLTFHGLRHSAATERIAAGIDPKTDNTN